ncbi:hypothetical protein, partial [Streptomyces laculatispora]|uniref:hypothetical protein n=1 Tax=Streptomyces laculatispora TaxID=887464 RepID=UPI001A94715D
MSLRFPRPATPLGPRARIAAVVAAVLLLTGGSVGYALHASHRSGRQQADADASFTLHGPALYFRDPATG